jgi:hypothetical protein
VRESAGRRRSAAAVVQRHLWIWAADGTRDSQNVLCSGGGLYFMRCGCKGVRSPWRCKTIACSSTAVSASRGHALRWEHADARMRRGRLAVAVSVPAHGT